MKILSREVLKEIEERLSKYMDSEVEFILKIGNYILDSGGKRLRPVLVLTFSKLLKGENEERDYPIAVAMEYLHTASLLHDDVVDGAETRRGKAAANRVFGNDTTVLTGDYMYANALYLFSVYGDIDMIRNVSDAVKKMSEGQLLELKKIGDIDMREEDYFRILEGKTAVLFGSCCYVGTALGGGSDKQKKSAYNYGLSIGIAFQLIDDLLDYIADEKKLGKPVCNDLREGKITYPLLSVLDKLSEDEKEFVKGVIRDLNPDKKHIERVKNMVKEKGGFDKTIEKAREYVDTAVRELENFPDSEYLKELEELAKYIVEREF
ncbi:MAG TPA: polyprenyl synthetase family protein [Persephonella sp.]|uniref:Octaprenyl-diphosphate synthase n=1 Tax=Persephonella marina (strain DSM 14350 / EX-H1) TaxID=123214 RepID=C0QRI2_PERMH|nr:MULTISPECIES: polyprenyl synthetase family protein [Persephonella]ACO03687.1 octaprenyl-diphosphate synthase [Persephonella marina EX-H1]HCB69023.1 polyprenyl synthetase family protein [Persephonella sp.]